MCTYVLIIYHIYQKVVRNIYIINVRSFKRAFIETRPNKTLALEWYGTYSGTIWPFYQFCFMVKFFAQNYCFLNDSSLLHKFKVREAADSIKTILRKYHHEISYAQQIFCKMNKKVNLSRSACSSISWNYNTSRNNI